MAMQALGADLAGTIVGLAGDADTVDLIMDAVLDKLKGYETEVTKEILDDPEVNVRERDGRLQILTWVDAE